MDVSSLIKRNKSFLEVFAQAKGEQLQYLAETLTRDQLKAICEVVLNYLNGILESSASFDRHRKFLQLLSDPAVPLEKKGHLIAESRTYRYVIKRLLDSVRVPEWQNTS